MPVESYEDDDDEQEGPRSSFGTYLAEGDALFKQSEYKKALESYSLALELQPNDKTCLVARSKCYLKIGDPQKALQDAEDALAEDKEFNKGLYRKAEALYCMGDFEYALMYYHRGHKLRPELDEFRLGIQKAQEAIDNSIGSAAKIKLENKGDLSFFTKQDDVVSKKRGYLKPVINKKLKPLANRNKEVKPPAPSKKTVKQLLGELYSDKEYFEKLMEDEAFIKCRQNSQIYELVQGGLNYLETRTEFWRQQKPLYARKKEKAKFNLVRKKGKPSISKYVLKQLEEIDQALSSGDSDRSLRLAQKLLKSVEGMNKDDLQNKAEVIANIHSCIGNAYIEMEQLAKALRHHEKDLELSRASKLVDGESRALDNVGRVHARMGNFKKAVTNWTEKLPLVKASLESTWLYHEIGRCHLELGNNQKAEEFGRKSLAAGKDCEDQIWQLNATVLIAQSQVKLGLVDDAIATFTDGIELAIALDDTSAQTAISKALHDLQRRSSQASGRYTSHSEEEGSPRIKSDMGNRTEAGAASRSSSSNSIKSPRSDDDNSSSLRDTHKSEDPHEGTNEEESGDGSESDNKDNTMEIHVNISKQNGENTADHDNESQVERLSDDEDKVSDDTDQKKLANSDSHVDSISDKSEHGVAPGDAVGNPQTIENLQIANIESDQPLTSGDLNRESSAEKLISADISYSESAENITSPDASFTNVPSLSGSIDNIPSPAGSNDDFISPIASGDDVSSEQVTTKDSENLPVGPVESSEEIASIAEKTESNTSLSTANVTSENVIEAAGAEVSHEDTNDVNNDTTTSERTHDDEDMSADVTSVAADSSQESNIEDLPLDSIRTTPDISTSEDATDDASTVDATSANATEDATNATTTAEEIPPDISEATLDSTAEEIPRDESQTTVDLNFEEETVTKEENTTENDTTKEL